MDVRNLLKPSQDGSSPFTIPAAPLMAFLDVTNICNLRCTFCYNHTLDDQEHPSIEILKKILNILSGVGCKEILYLGGEPFLHPKFKDLLETGQKLGLSQAIVSNGQNIDEKMADFLAEMKDLLVGISLHGYSPTQHDGLTGVHGSWQKAINAINNFEKRNINWYAQTSVLKSNYQQLKNIHQLVANLGRPKRLDLSRMIADGRGKYENDFLSKEDWGRVFSIINDSTFPHRKL